MADDRLGRVPSTTMARRWARKIERCCCTTATYFPLAFVYGLTTWAVWVVVLAGSGPSKVPWLGKPRIGFLHGIERLLIIARD
jgi:hypothetical protein